ncbi:MAG: toprim domain-containing protein [Bacteroidota bacterium]
MNIKQVKEQYSLPSVLALLGHEPDTKKSKTHDFWYKSPFRPGEDTPSFHVNVIHDIYKDFGDSEKGGDLIWFAQRYLRSIGQGASVSDALRWFERLGNAPKAIFKSSSTQRPKQPKDAYQVLSIKPIFSKTLFDYLNRRKIPIDMAREYLKQIYFQHPETGRKLYGLAFKTRAGSYDVRNALGFKTMIGKKDISIIKGQSSSSTVEVFEGVMDFLSYLAIENKNIPNNDCIILNSANLNEPASQYILDREYTKVILWPDNDLAGRAFKSKIEESISNRSVSIIDNSKFYSGFKDLNDWLVGEYAL